MEIAWKVFCAILETFIVFGIGALTVKWKMLDPKDLGKLTRLSLDVFFPLLTFVTIINSFDYSKLSELWIMPLLGFGLMMFGAIAGFFFKRFLFCNTPQRNVTFHHICAINNYVFLPLIVLQNLWGERHIALLLMMNVGSTIGFWTIGILTLTGVESVGDSLKRIFSVNLLAVFVAVLWALTSWGLPGFIMSPAKSLGNMSIPFMLILTGAALYECGGELLKNKRDIAYLSVIRLIVIPLMAVFLLKMLPLPQDVYEVTFVVAVMPAAASSVLVARQYGGSAGFSGQAIIITTLLSLLSIPFLMALFL